MPETCGEIVSIYVLQEYWHQGLGKMMLSLPVQEPKKLGFDDCALRTLEDNLRVQRAYESFGFERDGVKKARSLAEKMCGKSVTAGRFDTFFDIVGEENIC